MGHKKADCPILRGGAVSAPSLVTLRISVGREGRAGALTAKSLALQCQSVDVRVSSDVDTYMLSFALFMFLSVFYICFGILFWYK